MATKLPSGKYRAQVLIGTGENGKRIYKSFVADTADEAEYKALSYKLGIGKTSEKKYVTLRAAVEAYINSKDGILSPSTIQGYRVILRNFGDYLDTTLDRVTEIGLQSAIRDASRRTKNKAHNGKAGLSPKTLKNYRGLIKKVLKQNGIIIGDIDVPREFKEQYQTPFEDDIAAIFAATSGTKLEIPVLLAAWCSLRASEILGLQYGDFDFDKHIIKIRRAKIYVGSTGYVKTTKTETSTRTVYLPDYIADKVKETEKSKGDFLFDFGTTYITKTFSKLLEKNGIKHYTFHSLRHSYASVLTAHGVDKKYIQELGGWKTDSVMTKIYTQTSQTLKAQINEMVDGVFNEIVCASKV